MCDLIKRLQQVSDSGPPLKGQQTLRGHKLQSRKGESRSLQQLMMDVHALTADMVIVVPPAVEPLCLSLPFRTHRQAQAIQVSTKYHETQATHQLTVDVLWGRRWQTWPLSRRGAKRMPTRMQMPWPSRADCVSASECHLQMN